MRCPNPWGLGQRQWKRGNRLTLPISSNFAIVRGKQRRQARFFLHDLAASNDSLLRLLPRGNFRPVEDNELLRRIRSGDSAAWRALYERYVLSIWRYAYVHCGGHLHTTEDVVSETFLDAVRAIRATTPRIGCVSAWLIGIVRHKLADQRRCALRVDTLVNTLRHEGAGEAETSVELDATELRGQVIRAMDQLPDDERLVLEWKYLDELSVREISSRLGRTDKAVESLLYRARRSFRLLLEDNRNAH